jgi:hypothetical protein
MVEHELKTDSEVFRESENGCKDYEIRFNDRDFQLGDILILRETVYTGAQMANGEALIYTGRILRRCVVSKLEGYGLKPGWVIMGVSRL